MSEKTRVTEAWARADKAKAHEIAAHERAMLFHETVAARFDQLGDDATAGSIRGRARAAWDRLQTARREEAATLALRAKFSN